MSGGLAPTAQVFWSGRTISSHNSTIPWGNFLATFSDALSKILERSLVSSKSLGAKADKRKLAVFIKRNRFLPLRLPRFVGKEIKLSNGAKYPGIILDKKINSKAKIEARKKKPLIA